MKVYKDAEGRVWWAQDDDGVWWFKWTTWHEWLEYGKDQTRRVIYESSKLAYLVETGETIESTFDRRVKIDPIIAWEEIKQNEDIQS